MLSSAADGIMQRKMVSASILKTLASVSPAFGMIGTLIGLIIILQKLVSDPDGLGPGLAIALITTLYGVIMQRMVFSPAASKVEQKTAIMRFRNFLVTEGLALLAEHRSPRYIQDRMNSYLDPEIHYTIDKKSGASGTQKKAA
jgi:chemotaxis protein MotA